MTTPAPTGTTASFAVRGIFVLGVVFALREARPLLAPVLIAIVLTFVLAPAVRWLRRRGVPDMLAALIMVTALIVGTVPVVTSLAQPAALWWQTAPETVARLLERLDQLRSGIPGLGHAAQPARAAPTGRLSEFAAPAPPDPIKEKIASEGLSLTGTLLGHGVSFVVSSAATLILLYFLLASEHWMLSGMVEAMPRRRLRALVLSGVRAAQRQIGRYLVALGCINAVVGACTAAAMWMLGAPNPVLWGVVAFVLQFVPYIGPLIVMGLLLVVGATTFVAVPDMLAPALTFLLIHAVESNLVSPWIVGRRLSLSPVSVFLSVMFWGWLWGIPGALIAVPVLIALRNLAQRSRRLKLLRRFLEGDRDLAPSMRSLLRLPVRTRGVTPRPVVNIPAAMSPASTPVEVDGTREASGALPSWGYRFESPPA